jgi:poly(A) polymerase/tRNA nucleotidyltransferase (CCA-adding enzyme)
MRLPTEVQSILATLQEGGFEAYAVGGCVRDLMLDKQPKDWDVTTNAKPEQIQKLFPEHVYENTFGTVAIKTGSEDPTLALVEVTPYRIEGKYSDKRHPDDVQFADKLEDDLSRRDFTVNAMAMDINGNLIDLYEGQKDLKKKLIRTVGDPEQRFNEDALRLLRAVRFASQLGFDIDPDTKAAIKKNAEWLRAISKERIRDEFVKTIESDNAYEGVLMLEELGLLEHIVPELREGIGVEQNLHHIYTVWEHNTRALKYTAEKDYALAVRLGALFHDIGKPRTKRGEGKYSTFYGHEVVGARMVAGIMDRLKFPKDISEKVTKLVRYHMFYYNVDEVTESSVRRLLVNVGQENVEDLLKIREADRIGSGRPKAVPYKLRHLKYIIDKVSHDPISVKMLKVNGEDVMKELASGPGPKVGLVLNSLLAEVLDDPSRNTREYLMERIHELDKLSAGDLKAALDKIEKAQEAEDKEIKEKYHV